MPLLSIIIPVYNCGDSLERCVTSIRRQTFHDWELILVNDGSTDNSLELCRLLAKDDRRITVIDKENEGAGPARNAGMDAASGKYLAFIDADDRIEQTAYEKCLDVMERGDYDLLVFGAKTEIVDDEKKLVLRTVEENIPDVTLDSKQEFTERFGSLYQKMNLCAPWNKIYKADIVRRCGLRYPPLRRMQDCVFNLLYYDCINSFCSVSRNFYIRTWHTEEFQRKKMPADFIDCAIAHYRTLFGQLKKWGVDTKENKVYFGDRFSEVILLSGTLYLPASDYTFFELYAYIRRISTNPYIHGFYREFKKVKKLRKKELAILCNLNLLLTAEAYRYLKRAKLP